MKKKLMLIALLLTGPKILASRENHLAPFAPESTSSSNRLTSITNLFPNSFTKPPKEYEKNTFSDKPLPSNFILAFYLKNDFHINNKNLFCNKCKKNLFPKNIINHLRRNCQTRPNNRIEEKAVKTAISTMLIKNKKNPGISKTTKTHRRKKTTKIIRRKKLKQYRIPIKETNKVRCTYPVEGKPCNKEINNNTYKRHYDNEHGIYSKILKQKKRGDIAKLRTKLETDKLNREIDKCICGKILSRQTHNNHVRRCASAMNKLKEIIEERNKKTFIKKWRKK